MRWLKRSYLPLAEYKALMNTEILRSQQKLDDLLQKASDISPDAEVQSHWARYLCVLVSGHIETSVRIILRNYAKNRATPEVVNFVDATLNRFPNPTMEALSNLARSFNAEWATSLEGFTDGQLHDHINSLISNRNMIAHGGASGVSMVRVKEYYASAKKVINFIDGLYS